MLFHFLALAALGALCAGCSAPAADTTLSLDNPANPAAASAPFIRPADVLATGEMPTTTSASTAMDMPGMTVSGPMAGMDHGAMPGMTMPAQPK